MWREKQADLLHPKKNRNPTKDKARNKARDAMHKILNNTRQDTYTS